MAGVLDKSYEFAIKVVNLYKFLGEDKKEYTLSRQLVRAGTSIGANVEEAQGGLSGKDFFSNLTIAYMEARETHYWIRLLNDTGYISQARRVDMLPDV